MCLDDKEALIASVLPGDFNDLDEEEIEAALDSSISVLSPKYLQMSAILDSMVDQVIDAAEEDPEGDLARAIAEIQAAKLNRERVVASAVRGAIRLRIEETAYAYA